MTWFITLLTSLFLVPPPVGGVADYQLGGAYEPDDVVQIVTRDRTDPPAEGVYNVCYVNAFQTQPGELDWWESEHPDLLLREDGDLVIDEGWPDEVILDISTADRRTEAAEIVGDWFAQCADDGYQAVEPDNLDAYTRSRGLLDADDAVAFAELLVEQAHLHGLAIGQKNSAELLDRPMGFDFAVTEECEVYSECGDYAEAYGRRVIEIEYTDNGREAYAKACADRDERGSILLRDRDVVPADDPAYVYEWC